MKLPNWLRAGLMTGAFIAVPGLIAALIDVVDDVASWAAGESLNLPDLSTVRSAFVAVVAGAIAAIVAFVVVTIYVEGLAGIARWAVDAVAVGGLTLVAVGAVVYVDVVSLETTTALAIAAFAAIVAFAGGWLGESRGRTSQ